MTVRKSLIIFHQFLYIIVKLKLICHLSKFNFLKLDSLSFNTQKKCKCNNSFPWNHIANHSKKIIYAIIVFLLNYDLIMYHVCLVPLLSFHRWLLYEKNYLYEYYMINYWPGGNHLNSFSYLLYWASDRKCFCFNSEVEKHGHV